MFDACHSLGRFAFASVASLFFATAPAIAQDDLLRVEMVTAQNAPVVIDLELSGTIESIDNLELGFRESGRVVDVLVDEGDHVEAGAPLARLDSVQQDQSFRVAQASLDAARATYDQTKLASDRAKAMLARGVGTRAARDSAVQAESEATGALERAESALTQAQRAVEDTVLRAPEEAVVTARHVSPGQILGAAQPALSLATLDGVEAVFDAPDDPHLGAALGKAVRLTALDVVRPEMTGTVTEISPLVDPQTGTVLVRVRVDGIKADTSLLGAAVRGHIDISAATGIAVPWTALMRDRDSAAVWTVGQDQRVKLVPVTISYFVNGTVFLSGGIEAGQTVVGAGSQLLYPGRQVQRAEVLP